MPEDARAAAVDRLGTARMAVLLREPAPRWFGSDPRKGQDAAMLGSLRQAVAEAKEKLGADPAAWRWGALHKLTLRHPLATNEERKALFNLPPVELGGDDTGDVAGAVVEIGGVPAINLEQCCMHAKEFQMALKGSR